MEGHEQLSSRYGWMATAGVLPPANWCRYVPTGSKIPPPGMYQPCTVIKAAGVGMQAIVTSYSTRSSWNVWQLRAIG